MKWFFPVAILALGLFGCSTSETDIFEVDAAGLTPVSATLELYGIETPMTQKGEKFQASRSVERDGSGKIIVFFEKSEPTVCHIGYVTNGFKYHMKFKIKAEKCKLVQMFRDNDASS